MTSPSQSPSHGPSGLSEYGNFPGWQEAVASIRRAVYDISQKSQNPVFVATVSEAEFNSGSWMAMPVEMINSFPDPVIISMFNSLYPNFRSIDVYGKEISVGGDQKVNQVLAVYRA